MTEEYGPGYGEDYDSPSISVLAIRHDTGRSCAECGTLFVKPHGQPVLCGYCARRSTEYPKATHEEVNKEGHKQLARQRRKERTQ